MVAPIKHGLSQSEEYRAWAHMRYSCISKSHAMYKNNGGRGIKVCDRWNLFINFFNDMGPKPIDTILKRINKKGDFSPENCIWEEKIKIVQPDKIKVYRHGLTKSSTYKIWSRNRTRCNNPFDDNYNDYGGKGIKVCQRWDKFEIFLDDMGFRPKDAWLVRIDKKGDFCPENCSWLTGKKPGGPTKHGLSRHPLYPKWTIMMNACYNKYNKRYALNGEQGVIVYKPWHDVVNFLNHFKDKPKGSRLYRKDRHGNYTPENYKFFIKKT